MNLNSSLRFCHFFSLTLLLIGCNASGDASNSSNSGSDAKNDLPIFRSIDLGDWALGIPIDEDNNGRSDTIQPYDLVDGYTLSPYFEHSNDKGITFLSFVSGPKTSTNTTYTRSELREMLRRNNTKISTQGVNKNNWVFSSTPQSEQDKAGGVDGTLEATLAVNHVTVTGDSNQIGRVVIGQIHATKNEPVRIYYRKLKNNTKGAIYLAHEPASGFGDDQWYELIGQRSSSAKDPEDGIALNEKFGYKIQAEKNNLTVTIIRPGKPDVSKTIDITNSGYDQAGQYMYFKAGVYNLNKSGDSNDFAQATFYSITNKHQGYEH